MVLVVVLFPVSDDGAGFINMVEGIHVQAFIAHATVKGFNVPVTPRLTWWNVMDTEFFFREFTESMEMNSVRYRSVDFGEARLAMIVFM